MGGYVHSKRVVDSPGSSRGTRMAPLDRMVYIEDLFSRSQACGERCFSCSGHPNDGGASTPTPHREHTGERRPPRLKDVGRVAPRAKISTRFEPTQDSRPFPALQPPALDDHGGLGRFTA